MEVNNGNKSKSMQKMKKQSIPKVMNLLCRRVNVKSFWFSKPSSGL